MGSGLTERATPTVDNGEGIIASTTGAMEVGLAPLTGESCNTITGGLDLPFLLLLTLGSLLDLGLLEMLPTERVSSWALLLSVLFSSI